MSYWVLILTLITWDGVAIVKVPFAKAEACEAAAKDWMERNKVLRRVIDANAACYKTS